MRCGAYTVDSAVLPTFAGQLIFAFEMHVSQILPIVIFQIIHFDKNPSFIIGGRLCVIRLKVHHRLYFTGWSSDMSPIAQGYNFASGTTQ